LQDRMQHGLIGNFDEKGDEVWADIAGTARVARAAHLDDADQ